MINPKQISYIEDTYGNWVAAKSAKTLPVGFWIKITDRADLGLSLFCEDVDKLSLSGGGCFLNPDFGGDGDYSGLFALTGINFNSYQSIWYSAGEGSYVDGDIVLRDGFHFQVVSAVAMDGNNPVDNPSAYFQLPKSLTLGYKLSWDSIKYNIDLDSLLERSDIYNNIIHGADAISKFQWGWSSVSENQVFGGTLQNINQKATCIGNKVFGGNLLVTEAHLGTCNYNIVYNGANVTGNKNTGQLLTNCSFADIDGIIVDLNSNDVGKHASFAMSTFEVIVDVTGLTVIDLAPYTFQGLIHLSSSNTSETFDNIINTGDSFNRKFDGEFSANFCDFYFNDISINAGNIYLEVTPIQLRGGMFSGLHIRDKVEFEFRNSEARKVSMSSYLTS